MARDGARRMSVWGVWSDAMGAAVGRMGRERLEKTLWWKMEVNGEGGVG